ncbi:hypothetical protein [Acinetobacter ursingii]|uniref:hypothetical protein n=1 Tax=Acinetobacter ursingii TaxID=108980 RepID=UPI00300BBD48
MLLKELEKNLSPQARQKLNTFKALVNPSMNANFNSSDELAWYDFIIQIHLDQCEIDYEIFQQWLIQDIKFSGKAASILSDRLSSGLFLLNHYES